MRRRRKRYLAAGMLAACLLSCVPVWAAEAVALRCQKEEGGIQLTLEGLSEAVNAIQLELTLEGEYTKAGFTAAPRDAYSPDCHVEANRKETVVTIYLVADGALRGPNLRLGKLEEVDSIPIEAEALMLDGSLEAISGSGKRLSIVEEKTAEKTETESKPAVGTTAADNTAADNTPVDNTALPGSAELTFEDVKPADWCYQAVRYVCEAGLMQGISAERFSPDTTTTRGQIVAVLYRLDGSPEMGRSRFSDVASGSYYEKAVSWASSNGIVNGYADGTFRPNNLITREQIAAFLYRFAVRRGKDVSFHASLNSYKDANKVSAYAVEPLGWAIAAGVVNGTDAKTLSPGGNVSRAQVAVMLSRFAQNVL